jgi:hypothetical protein
LNQVEKRVFFFFLGLLVQARLLLLVLWQRRLAYAQVYFAPDDDARPCVLALRVVEMAEGDSPKTLSAAYMLVVHTGKRIVDGVV